MQEEARPERLDERLQASQSRVPPALPLQEQARQRQEQV